MKKIALVSLCAASLFTVSAAMANTSADSAPDRLPMLTSSTSAKAAPATAADASMVWEGGQAGMRPAMGATSTPRSPRDRSTMGAASAERASVMAGYGEPYKFGAAN
jgi:hypothetical protein